MISIALSKGRILDETLPLLKAAGIVAAEDPDASRKLIIPTSDAGVRLIIVRATDVPTYVEYGAADLGIAGGDILAEYGGQGLYQPLDLKIARCRLMVAVRVGDCSPVRMNQPFAAFAEPGRSSQRKTVKFDGPANVK